LYIDPPASNARTPCTNINTEMSDASQPRKDPPENTRSHSSTHIHNPPDGKSTTIPIPPAGNSAIGVRYPQKGKSATHNPQQAKQIVQQQQQQQLVQQPEQLAQQRQLVQQQEQLAQQQQQLVQQQQQQ
jgi:hypothetical protein